MGLTTISVQLVFDPKAAITEGDLKLTGEQANRFDVQCAPNGSIKYVELLTVSGNKENDLDEYAISSMLVEIAGFVKNLPAALRDAITTHGFYILIGGWSPNDDQITNLILPPEFNLQTARLGLRYEFCLNDYHK